MREGWKELRLGELCDLNNGSVQTGPFGAQLHEYDYTLEGVGVIMPKDIIGNSVNRNTLAYISEEMALKLKKYRVKIGDIIYPRRGDIAKRAFIRNDMPLLCGTGCIRIRFEGKNIDKKYINYYLSTDETINWLESNSVGATMKNLSTKILKDLPIKLPPLETQRKIASILSAYDDLIENNLTRIKLLEEMAQQTYEEWFVRMRFSGYENAVIDEETGLPEGWEKVKLGDYLTFKKGKKVDEILDVYEIGTAKILLLDSLESGRFNFAKIGKHELVRRGDILMLMDGARSSCVFQADNGIIGSTLAKVDLKKIPSSFMFYYFQNNLEWLQINNTGAAIPHSNPKFIKSIDFKLPASKLLSKWESFANPILTNIWILKDQNLRLKEVRDILLPRLMNGMIEV